MTELISIDPGDKHVGVAWFSNRESISAPERGWACVDTMEWEPEPFADWFQGLVDTDKIDIVVFEKFRLYPDKAAQQTGSEFETSQLIGIIKYIVRRHNDQPGAKQIEIVKQPAEIQQPTQGILRTRRIKSTSKQQGTGTHTLSAELHGWHFVLRTKGWTAKDGTLA